MLLRIKQHGRVRLKEQSTGRTSAGARLTDSAADYSLVAAVDPVKIAQSKIKPFSPGITFQIVNYLHPQFPLWRQEFFCLQKGLVFSLNYLGQGTKITLGVVYAPRIEMFIQMPGRSG